MKKILFAATMLAAAGFAGTASAQSVYSFGTRGCGAYIDQDGELYADGPICGLEQVMLQAWPVSIATERVVAYYGTTMIGPAIMATPVYPPEWPMWERPAPEQPQQ